MNNSKKYKSKRVQEYQSLGLAFLLFYFCILALPSSSPAAVAIDQSASLNTDTGGASHTVSFTCTTGATLITVGIGTYDTLNNISGITYNSTSGTKRFDDTVSATEEHAYIWTLPGTGCDGAAHNLVVSYSPSSSFGAAISVSSWTGTNPTPGNTAGSYNGSTTSPKSTSITMSANSVALDVIYLADAVPSIVAGQTQIHNLVYGASRVATSYRLSATAMGWTFSGTHATVHGVMEIKEAAGGGGAPSAVVHRRIQ